MADFNWQSFLGGISKGLAQRQKEQRQSQQKMQQAKEMARFKAGLQPTKWQPQSMEEAIALEKAGGVSPNDLIKTLQLQAWQKALSQGAGNLNKAEKEILNIKKPKVTASDIKSIPWKWQDVVPFVESPREKARRLKATRMGVWEKPKQKKAPKFTPTQEETNKKIKVKRKSDGQIGTILQSDFDSKKYIRVK